MPSTNLAFRSGGGSDAIELTDQGTVTPTIKGDVNGTEIEVTPVYTKEVEGTINSNDEDHTTLCGETQVEKNGDRNWRITIQGVVLKQQLERLKTLRPTDEAVRVITGGHTGDVVFDQFTWTQKDEMNQGQFTLNGTEVTEPIFTFQLQTREEGDN